MFTDTDSDDNTKSTSRPANVTDDSCRLEYIEIVPLTRYTGDSCTTESDSGDWSAQVNEENLPATKQEPDDDDMMSASCCTTNDEDDETHSHMKPDIVPETLNLANMNRQYSAGVCMGSSIDEDGWKVYRRVHHSVNQCLFTPSTMFVSQEDLTIHRKRHAKEEFYSCSRCEKRFSSQRGLYHHMNIHAGKYKCTECGKCCQSSSALEVHSRSHSGQKPFQCSVCNKRFTTSGDLVRHSRIHSGEKPFKCQECNKAFAQFGDLKSHMRAHTGDKLYKCSLCNKRFSQSSSLQRHERRIHSNTRPYQCPLCHKVFATNSDLKCHVHIHTDAKPYSCIHCLDHFTFHIQLKTHLLKSHNEGAWLTCHICQKKFCRSGNLKRHVCRHKGVKPYVCTDCPE